MLIAIRLHRFDRTLHCSEILAVLRLKVNPIVSATPSGASTAENPLISKILANGGATATVLWGYIGPSSREGFITLHPSLRNLSVTMEIAERDIIHVADVPDSIFPFNAK